MGAQRDSEQESEELSIVVDISRDDKVAGAAPVAIAENSLGTDDRVLDHSPGKASSASTADKSEGTEGIVEAASCDKDEVMEEGHCEGALQDARAKPSETTVPNSNGHHASESVLTEEEGLRDNRLLPQEYEGANKQNGARKRKKTIHYMNSRVPHSNPALDTEQALDSPEGQEAEETPVRLVQAPRATASKLKAMVRVGDKLLKPPRNAKELMATGLLEGHYVRCSCRGEQIVSISAFEAHSGSTSHHPSDNIYLENGKNLRDILSAGQEAADCEDNILRALKHAIGEIQEGTMQRKVTCSKCGSTEGGNFITCQGARCTTVSHAECIGISSSSRGDWACGKCDKTLKKPQSVLKAKRPALGTEKEESRSRDKELTMLARSARDAHLHKALFLPGGLADGTELGYYARNQCILKGVKRGEGICCSCCNQEISCSAFEQHAGCEARRNPYGSILLADGRSLKDMCKELADQNKLGERAAKRNAQAGEIRACVDCGEGGGLTRCHGCDLTWCHDCAEEILSLGTEKELHNNWYCRICQKDNAVALKGVHKVPGKRIGAGANLASSDDQGRPIRHLQAHNSVGGCAICKKWNDRKSGFDGMTMLVCDQCGQEYHVGCLRASKMDDVKELPEGEWFCQKDCKNIDEILTQLVANGPESLSDSIIAELLESRQQQGGAKEMAESSSPIFGWQILCGRGGDKVNGQTLAEAVDIFSECLDPIRDTATGRNLIPIMVHSRRVKDYDFEGIFCVVLKLNGKVVSTALLQIFGRQIAEVPLVATSLAHQGQGFCKALMTTIERLLGVLSVERLVLPTAKDAESIWVNKFGFTRMEDPQLSKLCTTLRLLTFTGSYMLEKPIPAMTV